MGERRRRAHCHTPEKDRYRYQAEAERAALDAGRHLRCEMEAYECRSCGWWHLTRVKPPRPRVYGGPRQGHAVEAEGSSR